MSRKFNKTLIASAIALSASTVLAGNQQSEAVNSEQVDQDLNAATSSTQTENAINEDSANVDAARAGGALIMGEEDTQPGAPATPGPTLTENAINEDSANVDASSPGGAATMSEDDTQPSSQATADQVEIVDSSSGFSEADRDGDGYISQDEAENNSMLKDRWSAVDTNSDQRIDRAEFSALEKQPES